MCERRHPRLGALAVLLVLGAACVPPPEEPLPPAAPPPPPLTVVELPGLPAAPPPTTVAAVDRGVDAAATFAALRAATVRIRSVSCRGVGVGSGFFVDGRTIATNAHVVDGASQVDVETWDGRQLRLASVEQAEAVDLALVHLAEAQSVAPPPVAARDPAAGDPVEAYGYPEGEPFAGSPGRVLAVTTADGARSVRTDVVVVPGNSGGPLVGAAGEVVGVVYAREVDTGWGVAIPATVLRVIVAAAGGLRAVSPC